MSIRISKSGYTLVEALIFLAVSSALAVSALAVISGQQAKTEFLQAVKTFESQVRDVGNDVSTGYFKRVGNVGCNAGGADSQAALNSAGTSQGTNDECVLAGRVMHFENEDNIKVYNVVGRRTTGLLANKKNVADIFQARSVLTTGPIPVAISDNIPVAPILRLSMVTYTDSTGVTSEMSGLAFFSTFGRSSLTSQDSGVISADIVPISVGDSVGQSLTDFKQSYYDFYTPIPIVDFTTSRTTYSNRANPTSGVIFCLIGRGVNRYALVTVGQKGAQASSTNVQIEDGTTCP